MIILKRIPLTILLFITIIILSLLTGTILKDQFPKIMGRFGLNLPVLLSGQFWRAWPSLFFSNLPGIRPTMIAVLLLGVGILEYLRGTKIASLSFFVLGPVATLTALFLLWSLDLAGISWVKSSLYTFDMGSSSASLTCWGISQAYVKNPLKTILIGGTFLILILLLIFVPKSYQLEHLIVFTSGLFFGLLFDKTKII